MLQRPSPRLILASASASRRALLAGAGLNFDVRPAALNEGVVKQAARAQGLGAAAAALRLAEQKALAVAAQAPDAMVIGADQILVCDGEWFDKPPDTAAARAQLLGLRGREHALATATACVLGRAVVWQHIAQPRLTMRPFGDAFLEDYLAAEGDAVTETVGAYRLETLGVQLFARVEGEHSAILGLPLLPLLAFLRAQGILMG